MTRTYHHGDTTPLSPHFNAREFRCKCDKEHDFQIDDDLITKLETLYAVLNCSKIIVTSGFRCVAHDKSVGGSGTGQHTLGKAADICCYGQDGQPISSKTVCCKAQDTGFTGIANITAAYIYTHVDVRSGGKWYGDEVHGNSSVTDDFYKYFGGEDMKGIDVSVHNGKIDWTKVKAVGIDFAILRAGYGKLAKQKDDRFDENYAGAKAAGIPVGAYWYSYATTIEEAKQEAAACLEVLKGKQYEYPIWFDQEEKASFDTGKANCSAMVRAFCDTLEKAGYWAGLYMSRASLQDYIDDSVKSRYSLWVAEWCSKLNYSGSVGIWQKSCTGCISGISGDVDLDIAYQDYPSQIKAKGLNGFSKPDTSPPSSDLPDAVTVKLEINGTLYGGTLSAMT